MRKAEDIYKSEVADIYTRIANLADKHNTYTEFILQDLNDHHLYKF